MNTRPSFGHPQANVGRYGQATALRSGLVESQERTWQATGSGIAGDSTGLAAGLLPPHRPRR